jgi:hypothetical protein
MKTPPYFIRHVIKNSASLFEKLLPQKSQASMILDATESPTAGVNSSTLLYISQPKLSGVIIIRKFSLGFSCSNSRAMINY